MLSIIIPCFDEAEGIAATLAALAPLRERGAEVHVVDGGRRDDTVARATPIADLGINAPQGRTRQIHASAERTGGGIHLFLHADAWLHDAAEVLIMNGLECSRRGWGRFDVTIA